MIAAIYARKSTDQSDRGEDEKSVTPQTEHARAYAARKGWTGDDAHVYTDAAISGAEFVNRPGLRSAARRPVPAPPVRSHAGGASARFSTNPRIVHVEGGTPDRL